MCISARESLATTSGCAGDRTTTSPTPSLRPWSTTSSTERSPPTIGSIAINVRFLMKSGVHPALAGASVGVSQVLAFVFARLPVDPSRVTVGGFSDGASYALSLGLANGDLFPRVLACSPGFVIQAPPLARPRVFISHGRSDQILPIDRCSRVIVPRLQSMRYDVTYREFDGRHEVPPAIATEALSWMTA